MLYDEILLKDHKKQIPVYKKVTFVVEGPKYWKYEGFAYGFVKDKEKLDFF